MLAYHPTNIINANVCEDCMFVWMDGARSTHRKIFLQAGDRARGLNFDHLSLEVLLLLLFFLDLSPYFVGLTPYSVRPLYVWPLMRLPAGSLAHFRSLAGHPGRRVLLGVLLRSQGVLRVARLSCSNLVVSRGLRTGGAGLEVVSIVKFVNTLLALCRIFVAPSNLVMWRPLHLPLESLYQLKRIRLKIHCVVLKI
ncbi:jg26979 [Pararge aegeria aegeria]|uniref:Jg26979 protein n=1 Tax=Pararge aegeria aegeria TaxID=348720 RepID=A0A8S4RW28_9NEOP|nr:jg26979 [Pararge aegeria aegeria]